MSTETAQQAERIGHWMEQQDKFARLLGIKLEAASPGYARASLTVRPDMLNAVQVTQGGVTFTLADFAFAVASNSHGITSLALSTQLSFPGTSREGDRLIAEAREENSTKRTGLYTVEVRTAEGRLVGLFSGTVFRRSDLVADWMEKNADPGG
ncbi:hotdog fold thioesterase [Sedimenticola thiotaurini]|nr:hotdog fold thioesterase [Sedimenticola thiotaurini]